MHKLAKSNNLKHQLYYIFFAEFKSLQNVSLVLMLKNYLLFDGRPTYYESLSVTFKLGLLRSSKVTVAKQKNSFQKMTVIVPHEIIKINTAEHT